MLYWHNPFPIYDATYIFKVYPRKKTSGQYRYYTTFFWGNDGTFIWDGGNANTYYGAHPYPIPAPSGPGQWEISVNSNDYVTGSEVQWNRWYTQAFRAWRESPSITHHEFYWDLPDTSKVLSHTVVDQWAHQSPPASDRRGPGTDSTGIMGRLLDGKNSRHHPGHPDVLRRPLLAEIQAKCFQIHQPARTQSGISPIPGPPTTDKKGTAPAPPIMGRYDGFGGTGQAEGVAVS
jgi:hypothetical protein